MTEWTPLLRDFIQQHLSDDTSSLLLSARKYPDIDVPFAASQIESRKRLKAKLPEWYANAELIMGGRIPCEQCSSEQTARYKQCIIAGAESMCDMTGGMGVDLYYMSEGMKEVIYTERQEQLCRNAEHNFHAMGRQIEVRQGDGRNMPIPSVDVIYLDPARRAQDGSRVYAIEDCEPNVIEWQDELLSHAKTLLVKLSPMVDITDALRKLKCVSEVHVVGVKNECKEILVKCSSDKDDNDTVTFHCIDFLSNRTMHYHFTKELAAEQIVIASDWCEKAADERQHYLYEPDVTLMKSHAFSNVCRDYDVQQLDFDTRLMTSDALILDFPGRIFSIDEIIPFSSKVLKRLKSRIPKANVAVRNFPLTVDELCKRTGIKDGGDVYLFGAKVRAAGNVLFKCSKVISI